METPEATPTLINTTYPCDKCEKVFERKQGLIMHQVRKHRPGKGWNSNKPRTRTRTQELKAIQNKKYRANHKQPTRKAIPAGYEHAAEAIINAANVLRAVAVGMRISQ